MSHITIIDYTLGNLTSVANAIDFLGSTARIARSPEELSDASHIILPGVGAFGDGMENLKKNGWVDALNEQVLHVGKPFLGICLGMQLIADVGHEHGHHEGLGWIPGQVCQLQSDDRSIRIPHIGWNDTQITKDCPLTQGLDDGPVFYYVHSYVLCPDDPEMVVATCHHGTGFPAIVHRDNIFATQFHPEKSQGSGITLLRNFLRL